MERVHRYHNLAAVCVRVANIFIPGSGHMTRRRGAKRSTCSTPRFAFSLLIALTAIFIAWEQEDDRPPCSDFDQSCTSSCNTVNALQRCRRTCGLCDDACARSNKTCAVQSETGLKRAFDRAASFAELQPRFVSHDPPVLVFDRFMSDEEAQAIALVCEDELVRSLAGDSVSDVRTSRQCWCDRDCQAKNGLVRDVVGRMHHVTATDPRNAEHLQIVHYTPGQFYKTHHDQNSANESPQGARVFTFFTYLNTPDEGGATHFEDLDLTISPRRGRAVLWASVKEGDVDQVEPRTRHEARTVVRGAKIGANLWIHQHDWYTPAMRGCRLLFHNTFA